MTTGPVPMHPVPLQSAAEWRAWLAGDHGSAPEAWLVIRHKNSGTPGLRYAEAVEQALCYGWIDSLARKRDPDSFVLRFSPRKPRSRWSRVNRQRIATLIEQGLMAEPGLAMVELAKASGTWEAAAAAAQADPVAIG